MLTHKDRVRLSIAHKQPDRVPKGDLAIGAKLLDALAVDAGFKGGSPDEKLLCVLKHLDSDLVDLHEYPVREIGRTSSGLPIFRGAFGEEFAMNENGHSLLKPALNEPSDVDTYKVPDISLATTVKLDFFRKNSDLFLFSQIGGPVSSIEWAVGMENMMIWCMTDMEYMKKFAQIIIEYELRRAKLFLAHGADAIIIADDIAFNTGALLPPHIMSEIAWPVYKEMILKIKRIKDVPVFLHTDGDIRSLMDDIVDCGFNGLHSLQPSAGVDILDIKKRYGDKLCLMGNLDLDRLMTFGQPAEIEAQVRWLCENIGKGGGYILSTCNILTDAIPLENVLAMYRAGV